MDDDSDPPASRQKASARKSSTVAQAGRDMIVQHAPSNVAVIAIIAITAVVALVVMAVLISSRTNNSSDTGSPTHTTSGASAGATSTTVPSRPSGRVPLFELTPDSPPVLNDETDTVDQQEDVKIKVARHFCTTGVPAVVSETYDLSGAYTTFTSTVGVDDDPSGVPVTFSVFADGVRVATRTVPVARTLELSADVTGKRKMTLETTTATCADVKAAWVWPTLVAP